MTPGSLGELASSVRTRKRSATEVVKEALAAIDKRNGAINAFTAVTAERALAEAAAVDAALGAGRDPGALAGVPFAVKNLYDVAGLATIAGSHIDRDRPPAARDAALVRRLSAAGAILVGALNMDEYAFGFSTENTHHGPTRNPHDPSRVAGGSSGGAGAAIAASLVPLALGSDTNGSIQSARGALRNLRTEADLRPAEPRRHAALRREPRRRRPVRPLGRGSRHRL